MMDHRQVQQLEDVVKTYHNQQLRAHSSGQQGLGNDGHQPLPPQVVMNTMDVTSHPHNEDMD